ncbi:tetratricopeptide repeat protein [Sphaerisporangium sp. NPDC051011]|uniref:ATP-binding protein n=1 Tax=Sphaerisporangium sp. NPDC051011 TaxID=3155792 RepID=UPI003411A40D
MNLRKPVTVKSLVRNLWEGTPPDKARDLLYSAVTRLRRGPLSGAGEGVSLRNISGAYVLDTDPQNVDYHRFRTLRSQARALTEARETVGAIGVYREMARLRRGEPLAGLSGAWAIGTRRNLEEELLLSTVDRINLEIRQDVGADLLTELDELIKRFPFNEKLVELRMLALYRSGRPTDALAAYRQAHQRLARGVGIQPSPALREVHERILRGDPALLPEPGPRVHRGRNNLVHDTAAFTGRTAELDQILRRQARKDAVTVIAIDGMPGVGKTALAVHLAHRLTEEYPDGLLYLDLHSHDARQERMDPVTALGRLLRDLGVTSVRDGLDPVPHGLDERATMWRTYLAHRKVLIVLDDAAGHEQVRHLLPGVPGCLVLVTSRRRLVGLDNAQPLSLDVLSPEEAVTLFGRVLRRRRVTPEEEDDVATVVRLCGYLPLAIQMVASRLDHRAAWTVADLADRLEKAGRLLGEIRAGDREITAAFELSFLDLAPDQQRAFRRLGLHPGVELTARSVAALLGYEAAGAERFLEELMDHHLIAEPRRGRYRFHDLIREYARLLAEEEPEDEREATIERVLDYYLFTADAADRLLYPYRLRGPIEVPSAVSVEPAVRTAPEARDWLAVELQNLLLAAHYADAHGSRRHAALLARVLGRYLELWGPWAEGARLHERAVMMWRDIGDQRALAYALADLSVLQRCSGHYDKALRSADEALEIQRAAGDKRAVADLLDQKGLVHGYRWEFDVAFGYHEQALDLRRESGDRYGEVDTLNYMAKVHYNRGDYPKAARDLETALELCREAGDRGRQRMALNNIAKLETRRGEYRSALRLYEEAMSVDPVMGPQNEASWLNNVAEVYRHLDRYVDALDHYRKALEAYREIGDPQSEAEVLNNIGNCLVCMGKDGEALIHYQSALHIAIEISSRGEESEALRNIGTVHHRANRSDSALDYFEKALHRARGIGDVYREARALDEMGATLARTGEAARGSAYWKRALDLYEHLGVPEADALRRRLARRDGVAGS